MSRGRRSERYLARAMKMAPEPRVCRVERARDGSFLTVDQEEERRLGEAGLDQMEAARG